MKRMKDVPISEALHDVNGLNLSVRTDISRRLELLLNSKNVHRRAIPCPIMSTTSRKNCDHLSKYCDLVQKHSKFYIVTDSTKLPIITVWSINFQCRLQERNSSNVRVSAIFLCMTNIFSF